MQILYHITWQQTGKLKRRCSEEFGLVEVLKGEQLLKRDWKKKTVWNLFYSEKVRWNPVKEAI